MEYTSAKESEPITGMNKALIESDLKLQLTDKRAESEHKFKCEKDTSKEDMDQLKADNKAFREKQAILLQDKTKMFKMNSRLEKMLSSMYRLVRERDKVANQTGDNGSIILCANTLCSLQFSLDDERYPCVQCGNVCCKNCYNALGDKTFFCGKCRRILSEVEKHFASGGTALLLAEELGNSSSGFDPNELDSARNEMKDVHPVSLVPRNLTEPNSANINGSISDEELPDDLCIEIPCQVPTNINDGIVVKFSILYSQFENEEEETLMPMKRLNMSKTSPISGNLVAKCCGSYIFKLTSCARDAINVSYELKVDVPRVEEM